MKKHTYKSLAMVAIAACVTVTAADRSLGYLVPVTHRREVQEGMEDFARVDPETLVIGSSHGRTFHVLGKELSRITQGSRSLVSIPLENGKLTSYAWLLDNRVLPLLTGPGEQPARKRHALKRLIVITEWWDSCRDQSAGWNLPSRAWTFKHYIRDVMHNGSNSYNRNYVQSRWHRLFWGSSLVQDRGFEKLLDNALAQLKHRSLQPSPEQYEAAVKGWQSMVEQGLTCLGNPVEMAALEHLLRFGSDFHLDTTVVLFPRKPDTLTDTAKATTLKVFYEKVAALTQPTGARFLDLTWSSPLQSDDFMDDFDHVSAEGNQKFAQWALAGPLKFLLDPTRAVAQDGAP